MSTATVSHVVNNSRFVSEETKQKVLTAIEQVGYTPNAHARNRASKQNHPFGLILSDLSNPFFPELVKSIQERAIELGYDISLANTNYDSERTVICVQRMLEQRISGVAVPLRRSAVSRTMPSRQPSSLAIMEYSSSVQPLGPGLAPLHDCLMSLRSSSRSTTIRGAPRAGSRGLDEAGGNFARS